MHPWLSGFTAQWSIDEQFRGMMIPKKVLHLSKTVGQGDGFLCLLTIKSYSLKTGEFGLVYKGYMDTALGTIIVAIKTSKGIYS